MKVRERVRLHLKTKRTIDGVLLSKRRGVYALRDAFVENEDGKLVTAPGTLYVDRCDVEFVQQGWAS
jgi:hypothetical protein